jgi:hypothetical protein
MWVCRIKVGVDSMHCYSNPCSCPQWLFFCCLGDTGVGKSVVARGLLQTIAPKANYVPIFINFSAQTSSMRTQEMIEGKLEKKRKNIMGEYRVALNAYTDTVTCFSGKMLVMGVPYLYCIMFVLFNCYLHLFAFTFYLLFLLLCDITFPFPFTAIFIFTVTFMFMFLYL